MGSREPLDRRTGSRLPTFRSRRQCRRPADGSSPLQRIGCFLALPVLVVLSLPHGPASANGRVREDDRSPRLTCSVSGRVVDESGTPIEGAVLRLEGLDGERYRKEFNSRAPSRFGIFEYRYNTLTTSLCVVPGLEHEIEIITARYFRRAKAKQAIWRRPRDWHRKVKELNTSPPEYELRTGPDGAFRAADIPEGPYLFSAGHPGTVTEVRLVWPCERHPDVQVDFVLEPSVTLKGTITDPEGRPVAGASLRRIDVLGETLAARADENGRYEFPGLSRYGDHLNVEAKGYQRAGIMFDPWKIPVEFPHDLVIKPSNPILGFVSRSGSPVAGAEIVVNHEVRARTDRRGWFRVDGIPEPKVDIWARQGEIESAPKNIELGEGPAVVRLELLDLGNLVVSVRDPAGMPLEGILVCAYQQRDHRFLEVATDENGIAKFESLRPGRVEIDIRTDEAHFAEERLEIVPGKTTKFDYVKRKGFDHTVRILLENGSPASAGTRVLIDAKDSGAVLTYKSGTGGIVHMPDLTPGDWNYTVTLEGYLNESRDLHVPGPETKVTLHRPRAIEGELFDANGKPIVEAKLQAINYGAEYESLTGDEKTISHHWKADEKKAITNSQGRFTFEDLRPGKYLVRMLRMIGGRKRILEPFIVDADVGSLEIRIDRKIGYFPAREPSWRSRLPSSAGAGVIHGTVVDSNGKPIPFARVYWRADSDIPWHENTLRTDSRGRFRIQHLEPGHYGVRASFEQRQGPPVTTDAKPGGAEIKLWVPTERR